MERLMSDEEKIRRAIEISQRRNQNNYSRETTRVNVNDKKEYKLFKKMILQIIICLLIYIIFHLISTTNYAFSDEVIKSTNNILNYDINLESIYHNCVNFFTNKFNTNNDEKVIVTDNKVNVIENIVENNNISQIENKIENKDSVNNVVENKEGDDVEENNVSVDEKENEKSAMEIDADKAKKVCKFQIPLNGTITSEFGQREATINGMTTDHKGIDIAAESGTNIKSAMSGTVVVAEENSEYGKFIKIENKEVMTVYAHCKKLKVKVGDKIKIGQTIATVGSTGNSTGPHLHFEIRFENRFINPRLLIKF